MPAPLRGRPHETGSSASAATRIKIYAARAAAHYWEEPVISGSFGSGAVFFSGCTLKCLFCQNGVISQQNRGKEIYNRLICAKFS